MNILPICSSHLSDAATLPWETPKRRFFNSIIHTLQIIYIISEENK